ncbi:hypothetical protein OE88DRAFT_1653702 [Heliocybe sulcata]|uniref:WD40 repeat-like protein n=1 Tax=Heliocybe sulcata TaxID=5364 RepID=A0A5C3NF15_9AGAM|nr:hypothetical protein OE88DRAFT_1653702 [Heliocybe sulcata]
MISSLDDADFQIQLGEDKDDVLNELAVNRSATYLAFGTDAGSVGVVELASNRASRMRVRHENICGNVSFIPDRPNELISGGYDSAVLHFDFQQGSLLSRFDITASPPSSGVSLSPPFILAMALSTSGVMAVGTADGRVWIGTGGEKGHPSAKKKRSRKWEGLREDEGVWLSVAEGPVVGVSFIDLTSLLTCTLLGTLTLYSIVREEDRVVPTQKWTAESKDLAKVNAMSAEADRIVVGGFNADGRGVFTISNIKDTALATS